MTENPLYCSGLNKSLGEYERCSRAGTVDRLKKQIDELENAPVRIGTITTDDLSHVEIITCDEDGDEIDQEVKADAVMCVINRLRSDRDVYGAALTQACAELAMATTDKSADNLQELMGVVKTTSPALVKRFLDAAEAALAKETSNG